MAVVFDAASRSSVGGAGATSLTWSHTVVATGGNRILIVGVAIRGIVTPSGITYNGVALTQAKRQQASTITAAEIWYLVNPAVGANNVVITMPSAENFVGVASSYTNVNPSTPTSSPVGSGSLTTAPSTTVTSAVNDMAVDMLGYQANTTANIPTVGAGQTINDGITSGANTSEVVGYSSRENGAASVTMSWTTASRFGALAGLNLKNLDFTGISSAVGQTTETDAAQSITPTRFISTGEPSEADSAQTVGVLRSAVLGQPSEADVAQPIAKSKALAIGQPSEVDLAQPIQAVRFIAVGQVTETDLAQLIQVVKAFGQVQEVDLAQSVSAVRSYPVGQPSETDLAQSIKVTKFLAIGQATESDTSQLLVVLRSRVLGQATEIDFAQPITYIHVFVIAVGQALEFDTASSVQAFKVSVAVSSKRYYIDRRGMRTRRFIR